MNKALAAALLAATVLAGQARAAEDPHPGAHDARVRWVNYDPLNVVEVDVTDLRSTMVQFADDETVNVVAIGDQTAWSWQKVRNLLFIKPSVSPGRQSNMQVITLRPDGSQRVYQFDLIPQPETATAQVFGVNFQYPADAAAAKKQAADKAAAQEQSDIARQRLDVDLYYGDRNWKYVARGSAAIQPSEVSDNGEATIFRFPGNQEMPAIYRVTADGKEQIATVSVHNGELSEVNGVSQAWRLRLGDQVTEIWDLGFNKYGVNPRTGTTSPEVVRTVKEQGQ